MNRKTLVSVLLMVLAALAVSYAYFVDREKVSDTEKKQRTSQVFPLWRKADLTHIELSLAASDAGPAQKLVLERDADAGELDFRMLSPAASQVDAAAIDRLLSVLEQSNYVRKLDAEPSDFGAVRAHGRIDMGKVSFAFDLAGPAPVPEGSAYLRLDGKTVLVVSKDFVVELLRSVDSYRDKTVVPYLSIALRGLSIKGRTKAVELTRQDELSFLVGGENVRASRKTIDSVWSAFAEMRAESFLSLAEARKLTEDPVVVVRMTPLSGPAAELRLGAPCPGAPDDVAFLRLGPEELGACVPKGVLVGLSIDAKTLVDTGPFVARIDEVTELIATDIPTGYVLDVARKGGGFRSRLPKEVDLTPGENALFQNYLERLFAINGMDVAKGGPLAVPVLKFVLRRARGAGQVSNAAEEGTEEFELGRETKEGKLYARRTGDGARFLLDDSVLGFLRPHAATLRDESFWGTSATSATGALRDPKSIELDCGSPQKLTNGEGGWKSAGFPVDQAAAVGLADALRRAKPVTWLHPESFVTASIAQSKCRVHVTWEGESSAKTTVEFGDKVGTYVLAARAGDKTPCLLPADLVQLAKNWYVERAFLGGDRVATDIASLEVTKGARTVVLRTEAELGDVVRTPDAGRADAMPGPETTSEGPRSQIATLRANTALHLGEPVTGEFDRDKVEVKVTLRKDAGAKERTLTFAPKPSGGYFLRYDGVPATFELQTSASLSSITDLFR
ncbi:MAG: hypothetical protein U0174_19275 [Polyangiaceae bacterium]